MPIQYDPTGVRPGNLIPLETHLLTNSTSVAPIHGVFHRNGFYVQGLATANGQTRPLVYGVDYVFSPSYLTETILLGSEVFSYIVILDHTLWGQIQITYQALGERNDDTLEAEIIAAGSFDRLDPQLWLAFVGEHSVSSVPGSYAELVASGPLELLESRINEIIAELGSPQLQINFNLLRKNTNDEINQEALITALQVKEVSQDLDLTTLFTLVSSESVPSILPVRETDQTILIDANATLLANLLVSWDTGLDAAWAAARANAAKNLAQDVLIEDNIVLDVEQDARLVQYETDVTAMEGIEVDTTGQVARISANAADIDTVNDYLLVANPRNDAQDTLISALSADVAAFLSTLQLTDVSALLTAIALNTIAIANLVPVVQSNTSINGLQNKLIDKQLQDLFILENGGGADLSALITAANVVRANADGKFVPVSAGTNKNIDQTALLNEIDALIAALPDAVDTAALFAAIAANTTNLSDTRAQLGKIVEKDQEQDPKIEANRAAIEALYATGGAGGTDLTPFYIRANRNKLVTKPGGIIDAEIDNNDLVNRAQDAALQALKVADADQDVLLDGIEVCVGGVDNDPIDPTGINYQVEWWRLIAFDGVIGDQFGTAVAASGDGTVIAVGAPYNDNETTNDGRVYFYDWNSSMRTWNFRNFIIVSSTAYDNRFGGGLALSDDGVFLAVGAPYWRVKDVTVGRVYTYKYTGAVWEQRATVIYPALTGDDQFGAAVSLDSKGTALVIGSPGNSEAGTATGAVYTYDWNEQDWELRNVIRAIDSANQANFGTGVAIAGNGNTLAVGSAGYGNEGKVYVYDHFGRNWTQRNTVVASTPFTAGRFGSGVGLSGDGRIMVVGSRGVTTTEGVLAGIAYVYDFVTGGWNENVILGASDAETNDLFGDSVAISDDAKMILVGAPLEDTQATDAGKVYIFGTEPGGTSKEGGTKPVIPPITVEVVDPEPVVDPTIEQPDPDDTIVPILPTVNRMIPWATLAVSDLTDLDFNHQGNLMVLGFGNRTTNAVWHGGAVEIWGLTDQEWVHHSDVGYPTHTSTTDIIEFGTSVSMSGDGTMLAIGAIGYSPINASTRTGGVFIYDWDDTQTTGVWVQRGVIFPGAEITTPLLTRMFYGASVALSPDGGTLAVGAYNATLPAPPAGSETDGVVILYKWDAGTSAWLRVSIERAYDIDPIGLGVNGAEQGMSSFGTGVSLSNEGKVLAVGRIEQGVYNHGQVSIYHRSGDTWTFQEKVTTSLPVYRDYGRSVAISKDGHLMVVGEHRNGESLANLGLLYMHGGVANGSYLEPSKAVDRDSEAGDQYGYIVGCSGDSLLISSVKRNFNGQQYIYFYGTKPGDIPEKPVIPPVVILEKMREWGRKPYKFASSIDWWGHSVAVSGNGLVLMCSTVYDYSDVMPGELIQSSEYNRLGQVFIYDWDTPSNDWIPRDIPNSGVPHGLVLFEQDNTSNILYGYSLALDDTGDTVVIGMHSLWEVYQQSLYPNPDEFQATGRVHTHTYYRDLTNPDPLKRFQYFRLDTQEGSGTQDSTSGVAFENSGVALSGDGLTMVVGVDNGEYHGHRGVTIGQPWKTNTSAWIFSLVEKEPFYDPDIDRVRRKAVWENPIRIEAGIKVQYDRFGHSVAISNDGKVIAVGAIHGDYQANNGVVIIFDRRDDLGGWVERNKITQPPSFGYNNFGTAVALNMDGSVLYTSMFRDGGGTTGTGVGFIYDRLSNGWRLRCDFVPADLRGSVGIAPEFGRSMSVTANGDTLLIGALHGGADKRGMIYYWGRPPVGVDINYIPVLTDEPPVSVSVTLGQFVLCDTIVRVGLTGALHPVALDWSHIYGHGATLSGDGQVLALPYTYNPESLWDQDHSTDTNFNVNLSRVYIFNWNPDTEAWLFITIIEVENIYDEYTNSLHAFSVSLNTDGRVLVVGTVTPHYFSNLEVGHTVEDIHDNYAGMFTTYDWTGLEWRKRSSRLAPGAYEGFGVSCSLNGIGDTLITGVPADSKSVDRTSLGALDVIFDEGGRINTWSLTDQVWSSRKVRSADIPAPFSAYGRSVAISGDSQVLAVGSPDGIRLDNGRHRGQVHIYDWHASTESWRERNKLSAVTVHAFDNYGISVSLDFTGSVLAVGSFRDDPLTGIQGLGVVYIYDAQGTTWVPRQSLTSPDVGFSGNYNRFGSSLSISNDGKKIAVGQQHGAVGIASINDKSNVHIFCVQD